MNKSSPQRPPPPLPCPWFMFTHGKRANKQTFFSIPEDYYYRKKIPDLYHKEIWGCYHGWMVITDDNSNYAFLLDPVSMGKIELPPLELSYNFCALSSPPSNSNSIIVFFRKESPHLTFCHPGDDEWVEQDVSSQEMFHGDAISCEGKIYGFSYQHLLLTLEVADRQTLIVRQLGVEKPTPWHFLPETCCSSPHLLESCGEIFFVSLLRSGELPDNYVRDIDVYRMDFSNLAWVKVESLGDRAFFINDNCGNSMSCSAVESGVRGNSIYFIEEDDRSMYIFNMEKKSIFATLPGPNVVHNRCDPLWIMPLI